MCVFMYVRLYVCMFVCMCICLYICMYVCIVSEAILLLYSKPRGYRSRHFTLTHLVRFLYYNCLGFDLASDYTNIIPNTV